MTPAAIKLRLIDAADTLRRLPFPKHGAPMRLRAGWPDVVRDTFDDWWGNDTPTKTRRAHAAPEQIARMDEVLDWLHWLTQDQRRIAWAKACRVKWRRLEDMDGRCIRTLQNVHGDAVRRIARQLEPVRRMA